MKHSAKFKITLMLKFITLSVIILFCNVASAQSSYNQELEKAAKEVSTKISTSGKKSVAVLDFENSNKQISELGSWLASVFTTHLENSSKNEFAVKNRTDIEKAIQQIKSESGSGAYDSKTIQRLGEISGSDVIIYGEITLMDNEITVNIRTKNISLNATIGGVLVSFTATDGMRTKYDNYIETKSSTAGNTANTNNNASGEGTARTSRNPDCKTKNTGDYCFQNNTRFDLEVSGYGIRPSFTLSPGQLKCVYDLPAGRYDYEVREVDSETAIERERSQMLGITKRKFQDKGQFFIEACKEKKLIIK